MTLIVCVTGTKAPTIFKKTEIKLFDLESVPGIRTCRFDSFFVFSIVHVKVDIGSSHLLSPSF